MVIAAEYLPALLVWIGSLYSMPQWLFAIALVMAVALRKGAVTISHFDLLGFLLVTALCQANFLAGAGNPGFGQYEPSPYFLAYGISFLLARCLRRSDLVFIAWLIGFECLTVFLEVALGVNTVFSGHPEYRSNLSFAMLYFARPFGLSDGTNSFAAKLVAAIVIVDYLMPRGRQRTLLRWVLASALIINFSRSALLAVLVHYLIYYFFEARIKHKTLKAATVAALCLALVAVVGAALSLDVLIDQLNRGKSDGVDLSFRDVIWSNCLRFIESHPLLGNGSSRLYSWIPEYGVWEHPHNSLLHLLSANGILIAATMLAWLASHVRSWHLKLIIPILVFSMGQYGIFWGVSFLDIVFLCFVLGNIERPLWSSSVPPPKKVRGPAVPQLSGLVGVAERPS